MKYVITKSNKVKITTNKGHHKNLAKKSEVKSAGRFTQTDGIKVYSKSHGFNIKPAGGDAKKIAKKIKK